MLASLKKSRTPCVSGQSLSAIPSLIPSKLVRTRSPILSQPCCGAKVIVLEGTCHRCDLYAPTTDFLRNRFGSARILQWHS